MNVHECVSQQAGAHRASQRHCFLFINIYRCSRDLCNWICVMTSSCKCSQMWFMYGEFTELFSRRAEAVTIPNPKRKSCFHRGCLTPVYVSPRGAGRASSDLRLIYKLKERVTSSLWHFLSRAGSVCRSWWAAWKHLMCGPAAGLCQTRHANLVSV